MLGLEPVAWYRPIVMNTQEQLRQAFTELREGTFLKGKRKQVMTNQVARTQVLGGVAL
ncbi:MAG TPA: pirin-like C-terminal cupin domain-containing protein [Terriglobales bacterium]|nr:pirin-like C-terminal cupin domain-containing protein [Terriglobales bacterium]